MLFQWPKQLLFFINAISGGMLIKKGGTNPPLTKNTNLNQTCYKKTNHLIIDFEAKVELFYVNQLEFNLNNVKIYIFTLFLKSANFLTFLGFLQTKRRENIPP